MRQVLGRYHIIDELGRGGMGVVYKAVDPKLERFIAIKCLNEELSEDEIVVARFLREARNVAALNHPHIAQIYVADEHEGKPYFVMEYVDGESLSRFIQREGQCAPEMARRITEQAAEALRAAARENIVHRDVKPGNIMLDRQGRAVLTDFGIAFVLADGEAGKRTDILMGTPGYLPPEALTGHQPDFRGDIFALGATCYEMLTGKRLVADADLPSTLRQYMNAGFPDLSMLEGRVDERIITILGRMLATRPEDRYGNYDELLADLARFKAGHDEAANTAGATGQTQILSSTEKDGSPSDSPVNQPGSARPDATTDTAHDQGQRSRYGSTAPGEPTNTSSGGKYYGLMAAAGLFGLLIIVGLLRLEDRHFERLADLFSESEEPPAPTEAPIAGNDKDHSIAVLPFEALGGGDESPFVDGLHHELLTRLSHIRELRVISRTSVRQYQDTTMSIPDIGTALGAAWILEGGVQQIGDQIQLSARLFEAATDSQIWANTYRRALNAENLFGIQAEIVDDIATSMEAQLASSEAALVEQVPTQSLTSYALYVRGQTYLDTRSQDSMEQALNFFRNAVEDDPDYALAWVGLADSLILLHGYGYRAPDNALPEAETAVKRALQLEPDLAEAYASLGGLSGARGDLPGAIELLKQATELRPGYAEAHNWLSWNYQLLGFAPEALESAEKAVSLNPFSPEALTNLVGSLLANGQYDEALRQARHMHELSLPFTDDLNKALALYYTEHYHEAIDLLDGMQAAWAGGGAMALKAMTYIAIGEEQAAKGLLDELNESGDHFSIGMALAGLGERDAAFASFEKIEQWQAWPALVMHHYPDILGDIPSDPRFESMLIDMRHDYGLDADGSLP